MKRKEDCNLSSQVAEEDSSSGDEDDLIAKLQNSGMPTKRLAVFSICIRI